MAAYQESEAIARLTAYLNQTRRQAEDSIDVLNGRYEELRVELDTSQLVCERLAEERDYFKSLSEQLKLENSKKWRLNERDDWKSLVDSIQVDRARLQEECVRLEAEVQRLRLGPGPGPGPGGGAADAAGAGRNADSHVEASLGRAQGRDADRGVGNENTRAVDSGSAFPASKVLQLERELHVALQRNRQLELALQQKAAVASRTSAPSSGNGALDRVTPAGVLGSLDNLKNTDSASAVNSDTHTDTARVIQQQRKLAQTSRGGGSMWPLSALFGSQAAPHEGKAATGVFTV